MREETFQPNCMYIYTYTPLYTYEAHAQYVFNLIRLLSLLRKVDKNLGLFFSIFLNFEKYWNRCNYRNIKIINL